MSYLCAVDDSIVSFFRQFINAIGFWGCLAIVIGGQLLFASVFGLSTLFSYERRLKKALDKANTWLYKNKVITKDNIQTFTMLLKKGPKRLVYFWQQYILQREGGPSAFLTEANLIEKPLKTSSWASALKNLSIMTGVWSVISIFLGVAYKIPQGTITFPDLLIIVLFPAVCLLIGGIISMIIRSGRVDTLNEIYHSHHLFTRFLENACATLPPYIDLDLLFTRREIEKGNAQLREFYEKQAREAQAQFEKAQTDELKHEDYGFEDVGVDGTLLLNRAMKESSEFIALRTKLISKKTQIEAQKDALRRNYENIQMDLQRKIQASRENIEKLIEQQAATTSRIEVGLLRQRQDSEVKKQEELQRDYDKEESRYLSDKDVLDSELEVVEKELSVAFDKAREGMTAEYKTFFEKIMKSAYQVAENKVSLETKELLKQKDVSEKELINVQSQVKKLMDENLTLRAKLEEKNPDFKEEPTETGHYDEQGNYIYNDGSYHDAQGFFHDVDGKVYDSNGTLVSEVLDDEEAVEQERELLEKEQAQSFGEFVEMSENQEQEEKIVEEEIEEAPAGEPIIEEYSDTEEGQSYESTLDEEYDESPIEEEIEEGESPVEEKSKTRKKRAQSRRLVSKKKDYSQPLTTEKRGRGRPKKIVEEFASTEEAQAPAKKRGRPRKVVDEETTVGIETPAKKRGRPRKVVEESDVVQSPAKKRGRPKKVGTADKIDSPAKKRGRPRKTTEEPISTTETAARKRGRPRKVKDEASVDQINDLINQETVKLQEMKDKLSAQLDSVINSQGAAGNEHLIQEAEALKAQANGAKAADASGEELSDINKRIENLIAQISTLNNKK